MDLKDCKDFRDDCLISGCSMDLDLSYFDSVDFEKLLFDFFHCLKKFDDDRLEFDSVEFDSIKNAGKYVIDKHTDGFDTHVLYSNYDELLMKIIGKYGDSFDKKDFDDIVAFVKNNCDYLRVTDVPLQYSKSDVFNGSVSYGFDIEDEELLKRLPNVVNRISLEGFPNYSMIMTYIHEMGHALCTKQKGCFENPLHSEFFSIFLEKIGSLDFDSSDNLEFLTSLERLLNLKNNVFSASSLLYNLDDESSDGYKLNVVTDCTYILSSLLVWELFNIYKKGSNKLKKEIDRNVFGVFAGDHTLNDLINNYGLSYEGGSKVMRRELNRLAK